MAKNLNNHFVDEVARKKAAARGAENWDPFLWRVIRGLDAFKLRGGTKRLTGPADGKAVFDRPHVTVLVTREEALAEQARYEAETGKCGECLGLGEQVCGWSRDHGRMLRSCSACAGSGASEAVR